VTLTATPDAGHRFVAWSGACEGTTCIVTMNSAKTVTATFEPIPVDPGTSVVTVQVNGNGTVTSNPPGLQAPATPSFAFPDNTLVTLTAVPATDATFTGWGGACEAAGTNPTCEITVTAATSVIANFTGGATTLTLVRTASSSDSAEELRGTKNAAKYPVGFTYTSSSDLELAYDSDHSASQYIGLRFNNVDLPQGAEIVSAVVVFTAMSGGSAEVNLSIAAEAADTAAPFVQDAEGTASSGVSTRLLPAAERVAEPWTIPTGVWTSGQTYSSANFAPVVQAVVDRPGWTPDGSLVVIIYAQDEASTAYRRATPQPTLRIEYRMPTP
jgi:hypothetical protein